MDLVRNYRCLALEGRSSSITIGLSRLAFFLHGFDRHGFDRLEFLLRQGLGRLAIILQ